MADSSHLNILTPKRQKLSTDWGKCIVCQSKKNEILKNATDKSLQTLTNALSERRTLFGIDHVTKQLQANRT